MLGEDACSGAAGDGMSCWGHLVCSVLQVCCSFTKGAWAVSTVACWVSKASTVTILLCLSPFSCVNTGFEYLGAPMLGACVFTMAIPVGALIPLSLCSDPLSLVPDSDGSLFYVV